MLVTPFELAMYQIGIDRCGPLMTVAVPWDILQTSSRSTDERILIRSVRVTRSCRPCGDGQLMAGAKVTVIVRSLSGLVRPIWHAGGTAGEI
jgi:hypothetical protein